MSTRRILSELLERAVAFYTSTRDATYRMGARIFGVGEATVSRALRRYRETGSEGMPEPVYAQQDRF